MYKFLLISTRFFSTFFLVLCFAFPISISAQTPHPVAEWLNSFRSTADFHQVSLLSLNNERSDLEQIVSNATILASDDEAIDKLLLSAPTTLTFPISLSDGSVLELELAKVEILAPQFMVGTKGTNASEQVYYDKAVHYRGIVKGNIASIASLSVTSTGLSAMVADESGTFQLGMMEDGSRDYIFYKTTDLKALSPFNCVADEHSPTGDSGTSVLAEDRGVGCKTVNIYFECDYKLYTDKGSSVPSVTNYVTSLFNQISTLYANENVGVAISQIFVWTSPDPYIAQTSIGNVLNAFRQTMGTNFNGNLAHFLSTRSLGGGIAYVDVICFKQYAFGVSGISTTFQSVPTYSWSVEVVTHELGHNLGSWHTQSCNWPGGAIDKCVSPEGSCAPGPAPTNGGTIMSYCHLTGYGINFNNGFGPLPGAKIRDKVLAAACLSPAGAAPTGLTTTNITNVSATLNWVAVPGATNYTVQYKLGSATTWTTAGVTTATMYNLTNLTSNTLYNWQVKTDCSQYAAMQSFTTGNENTGGGNAACNFPANLLASNITTSSATLSWAAVAGATSYTVQYKPANSNNWLVAGTTVNNLYLLGGLTAATIYNWKVKADCSDFAAPMTFVTTSTGTGGGGSCSPPTSLTNNEIFNTSAVISWAPSVGATSYTLQIKLSSATNYATLGTVPNTTVTLNGLQPATSYNWRVKANCSFYSTSKFLTTLGNIIDNNGENRFVEMPTISYEPEQHFSVSPNPANNMVYLKHTEPLTAETSVELTTVTGSVCVKKVVYAEDFGLDVSTLSTGMYFLHVYQGDKRLTTEKVVVVR
jgi:hypothetical protein